MIDRRVMLTISAAALAGAGRARASARGKARTVAFVALADRDPALIAAFEAGLTENGLARGAGVNVLELYGGGRADGIRAQIADAIHNGAEVFVAAGTNVVRMIREQAREAPVVVASLESLVIVRAGDKIARPDGNVTGFATLGVELIGKRLELLREIMPQLARVAVVTNPGNRNHPALVEAARESGRLQGLGISIVDVGRIADMGGQLAQARADGVQAALFVRDFAFESGRAEVVAAANGAGLASMFDVSTYVTLGGLASYSPSRTDLFRRTASYVSRILNGERPADLPIQLPTRFELFINLRTARALGIEVPPSILIRADEVIE